MTDDDESVEVTSESSEEKDTDYQQTRFISTCQSAVKDPHGLIYTEAATYNNLAAAYDSVAEYDLAAKCNNDSLNDTLQDKRFYDKLVPPSNLSVIFIRTQDALQYDLVMTRKGCFCHQLLPYSGHVARNAAVITISSMDISRSRGTIIDERRLDSISWLDSFSLSPSST
ncbi:7849_t:CDS:2 [Paraglomus brasilianum]|uniref:7849_t:CDS:1 n=1 Tax=Paraglomus brasilianum TaxID=144538 RepID=A0A9N9CTX1_9GLOM|nr:7849_t:CDS:2 [Paraglomus brasilianum]